MSGTPQASQLCRGEGNLLFCVTPSPANAKAGSTPGGAAGLSPLLPAAVPSACAGAACASRRRGEGSGLFWAGRGPRGVRLSALLLFLSCFQTRAELQFQQRSGAGSAPECSAVLSQEPPVFPWTLGAEVALQAERYGGILTCVAQGFSIFTPLCTRCRFPLHRTFPQRRRQHRQCSCRRCTSSRQRRSGLKHLFAVELGSDGNADPFLPTDLQCYKSWCIKHGC